jgi:hypothetical protein
VNELTDFQQPEKGGSKLPHSKEGAAKEGAAQ